MLFYLPFATIPSLIFLYFLLDAEEKLLTKKNNSDKKKNLDLPLFLTNKCLIKNAEEITKMMKYVFLSLFFCLYLTLFVLLFYKIG
jgi:hypothetical protein